MSPESDSEQRSVELRSPTERGWWLKTRCPNDPVSIVFRPEVGSEDAESESVVRGPFRAMLVQHEGRMAVVQVFLTYVVGGHLVDVDTADGESRVLLPASVGLERDLGTAAPGCFAVARVQAARDGD